MHPKLIYINGRFLRIGLARKVPVEFQHNVEMELVFNHNMWSEPHAMHDRSNDKNIWNFHLFPENRIPAFNGAFNMNYTDISDVRAKEIEDYQNRTNLPIYVYWSGGIDSTLVVSAIVKNFKNLSQVTVILNNASYLENPMFFKNIILKNNIKFMNTIDVPNDLWMTAIVINGDPADQININSHIVTLDRMFPGSTRKNVYTDSDHLIKYLNSYTTPESAQWLYDIVSTSMKQAPVPINTYEDFFWWLNFNFFWQGQVLKGYLNNTKLATQESFNLYGRNFICWFNTELYQQWSLHNNSNGVKFSNGVISYKSTSKQYILDVDKNDYYYYYKTKTGSIMQYIGKDPGGINLGRTFAAFEDGSVISVEETYKILEMLHNNGKILK